MWAGKKSHRHPLTASLDFYPLPRSVKPQTRVKLQHFFFFWPNIFPSRQTQSSRRTQQSFQATLTLNTTFLQHRTKVTKKKLTCAGLNQPCGQAQRSPQFPLPLVLVLWGLFRTLSHEVTSLVLFEAGPPGPEEGIVWELYPSPWAFLCQPQAQWASLMRVGALLPDSMPSDPRLQLGCLVRYAFILHWCLPFSLVSSA